MIDALSMSLAVTGPFTRGFLFFWIAMLVACISIWAYEVNTQSHNKKIEGIAYWVFGSAMVVFAFVRPMGIARDDLPYLGIYASICPTLECGAWIQGPRDVVWYSLVGVLKSIFATPDVMLWLSATAFLIKLFLFYKLIDRPMPVLLLYTGYFLSSPGPHCMESVAFHCCFSVCHLDGCPQKQYLERMAFYLLLGFFTQASLFFGTPDHD